MRKFILSCTVILFSSFSVYGTNIEIEKILDNQNIEWSILNEAKHVIVQSKEYNTSTTAHFELLDDTRYYFSVIIQDSIESNTDLLMLKVEGAGIMLIRSDIGIGEYQYPFFTGMKSPQLKIIGGSSVTISNYPWQIYYSSGNYMCGGSIISENWVVTAAHCTQDENGTPIPVDEMRVKVGATNPYQSSQGKWYDVKSYTIHEGYNTSSLRQDIAVLELKEDINFANAEIIELVSAKEISEGATDEGVMATITGWGLTSVDPSSSPSNLQMVQLPLVSNTTASAVWGSLPESLLMAGYISGNKDACRGDSGGPLVVDIDGAKKLAGIVSFGNEACNTYGGYTRVSAFLDWIYEKTGVSPGVFLQKPEGITEFCNGVDSSTYKTKGNNATNLVWELTPDTAGQLFTNGEEATIVWDSTFHGQAQLNVSAEFPGDITLTSSIDIQINRPTVLKNHTQSATVCEGTPYTLVVDAEGDELLYRWFKDSTLVKETDVRVYSPPTKYAIQSGIFYCVIEGACGEASTDTINLSIVTNTNIKVNLEDIRTPQNEDVLFKISASADNINYQWYKDGLIIPEANTESYEIANATANDIGEYHVEVYGTCGVVSSDSVLLYVEDTKKETTRIWPTVVENSFSIASSNNEEFSYSIYNIYGYYVDGENELSLKQNIDAASWQTGIYIVVITSGDTSKGYRILKL